MIFFRASPDLRVTASLSILAPWGDSPLIKVLTPKAGAPQAFLLPVVLVILIPLCSENLILEGQRAPHLMRCLVFSVLKTSPDFG